MNDKRRLILISSALLTTSVLGAAAISQLSAAPTAAQAVVAGVPQGTATMEPSTEPSMEPTMGSTTKPTTEGKPEAYWQAYRKGFMEARDCDKGTSFSYDKSADWDRKGWVDGYNAGHIAFCENTG